MENENLKNQYYLEQCRKTLSVSRITSPIIAIIIALFLGQDLFILYFDFTLWYRLTAIIFFCTYFILTVTILKKYVKYTIPLYTIVLAFGIFMILGIAYHIFLNPIFPDTYISNVSTGIQTVFIVLFLIASGTLRYLPLLLVIPLFFFIVLLILNTQLTPQEWTTLSNPITTVFF